MLVYVVLKNKKAEKTLTTLIVDLPEYLASGAHRIGIKNIH